MQTESKQERREIFQHFYQDLRKGKADMSLIGNMLNADLEAEDKRDIRRAALRADDYLPIDPVGVEAAFIEQFIRNTQRDTWEPISMSVKVFADDAEMAHRDGFKVDFIMPKLLSKFREQLQTALLHNPVIESCKCTVTSMAFLHEVTLDLTMMCGRAQLAGEVGP